jgi:hypothetical protein
MLWLGVGCGGTAMPALAIREDISSEELRRQARRENDGRVSARLIAIANALDGMDRARAARLAGMETPACCAPYKREHALDGLARAGGDRGATNPRGRGYPLPFGRPSVLLR